MTDHSDYSPAYVFERTCLNDEALKNYEELFTKVGLTKSNVSASYSKGSEKSSTNPVLIFFMLLLGIGIGILIYRFLICKNK
jgi:hypothetical protein